MSVRRVPLNLFAIPFGIAGLGGTWLAVASFGRAPAGIGDGLLVASAAVWLVLLAAYLRYVGRDVSRVVQDLTDPVLAPFAALPVIVPMLIAADGVYPHAHSTGRVLVDVFVTLTVLFGGWFTGQWIYRPLVLDKLHPGYFLPTVAGGLIASASATAVGQRRLGEAMFGLGTICWIVLGSIILGRLVLRPGLPAPLLPTLAIEVAPAAVASVAYFALRGDEVDAGAAFLGGYGLLMVLAQLRLLPMFLRLKFSPGFWAFTFSWAAVATAAVDWLQALRPDGYRVYEYVVVAAVTVLVVGIAARTVVAILRGQLLLPPPPMAVLDAAARTAFQPDVRSVRSAGIT